MAILSFNTQYTGQVGSDFLPRRVSLLTTDNLATITTAGYLNNLNKIFPIFPTDMLDVRYSYSVALGTSTFGMFTPLFSGNANSRTITLDAWENPGDVLLPVVDGDFATFNGTGGQIKDAGYLPSDATKTKVVMANGAVVLNHLAAFADTAGTVKSDAATAINGGNIQAGLSGTAGIISSFPGTAAKGHLSLTAVANTGDTTTTISNAAMGQASVVSIPDPGASTANFITSAIAGAGTQTISTGSLSVAAGNLSAGVSGAAGTVSSFPATAANGSLILAAANNGSGDFSTTISNAGTIPQSQVVSIPSVGASTGQFLVKTAAFTNGGLVQASGTAGLTVDSGILTANVQLKTNIKAAQSANIGGGGVGPINITVTGATSSSVAVATVLSSSNAVSILKVAAGTNLIAVTFSADPGASAIINYVVFIAAQ